MSEINVNKIAPSTGTNVTLGDASDTFKVPSGVTLDVESGATLDVTGATVSGLTSTTINNNADNRVITGSGTANTLNGESTLTYDGTQLVLTDGTEGTDNLLVKTTADGSISMALEKSDLKYDLGLDHNNDGSQNFYIRERTKNGSTTNSKRMVIDNSGAITKPLQPAFMWLNGGGTTYAHNTDVDMVASSEVFDIGSNVSGSTFTAPVTGKYQISIATNMDAGSGSNTALIGAVAYIVCSNRKLNFGYSRLQTDEYDHWSITGSGLIDMDANDTCKGVVFYKRASGTGTAVTVGSSTDFRHGMSGFLVC